MGIINIVITILAILLIDKPGRRPLLLAGAVVNVSLAAYGLDSAYYELPANASVTITSGQDLFAVS